MIYQITGTQSFLTAVYLFVKSKSEQNYMLVCHCTFNDVFSTPKLPAPSGAHQKDSF